MSSLEAASLSSPSDGVHRAEHSVGAQLGHAMGSSALLVVRLKWSQASTGLTNQGFAVVQSISQSLHKCQHKIDRLSEVFHTD